MITDLTIRHFALIQELSLEFKPGLTAFTGETGAGKSLILDAIGWVMGDRAIAQWTQNQAGTTEVSAAFCTTSFSFIQQWLEANDLADNQDCIVRRVALNGKSKSFINGRLVTTSQVKQLSEQCILMHTQHQHQRLLNSEFQRELLDAYADHSSILNDIQTSFNAFSTLEKQKIALLSFNENKDAVALLTYQLQELEEFNLQENEWETLSQEHKTLANAASLLHASRAALHTLKEQPEHSLLSTLGKAQKNLIPLQDHHDRIKTTLLLLENASIQLEEAALELALFQDTFEADPNRIQVVDKRLSDMHALARKHQISPQQLFEHYAALRRQRFLLEQQDEQLAKLDRQIEQAKETYRMTANALRVSRQKAATTLNQEITERLKDLAMPHARFSVSFRACDPSRNGIDAVDFRVLLNPGQPDASLKKVASGGELSRIALAIQVSIAQRRVMPTLIFDEVDLGIGGKTASTVGKFLRLLGKNAQVLCITHSPQVASLSEHHFKAEKFQDHANTHSTLIELDHSHKIQEIARMLGRDSITQAALENAQSFLDN